MKSRNKLISGVLIWIISLGIVIGSLVLALSEGGIHPIKATTVTSIAIGITQIVLPSSIPTTETAASVASATSTVRLSPTATPSIINPLTTTSTIASSPTAKPPITSSPTPTAHLVSSPTATPTPIVSPSAPPQVTPVCAIPQGWTLHLVQANETLESLADQYRISPQEIITSNCLGKTTLQAGDKVYLPQQEIPVTITVTSPTKAPKHCNAPTNWVLYRVQRGDTLTSISHKFNTSIKSLQKGNCLGSSRKVKIGRKLYVPRQPLWFFSYPIQPPPASHKNQKVIPPPLTPIPVTPRTQTMPTFQPGSFFIASFCNQKTGTILATLDNELL